MLQAALLEGFPLPQNLPSASICPPLPLKSPPQLQTGGGRNQNRLQKFHRSTGRRRRFLKKIVQNLKKTGMVDLDEEKQVAQLRSETDAIRQCALLVGTFSQCAFPGPLPNFLVSRTRKQFLQNPGCRRVTSRPRGRDGSEAAGRHVAHVHAATTKSSCNDHPSLALLQTNHPVFLPTRSCEWICDKRTRDV